MGIKNQQHTPAGTSSRSRRGQRPWRLGGLALLLLVALFASPAAFGAPESPTLLLGPGDLFENRMVFTYAGDLWTAQTDGTAPRRLCSEGTVVGRPSFSPDGEHVVFSLQRNNNVDVYVLPSAGGTPRRLTAHPGVDRALGFSADGGEILLASDREAALRSTFSLFTVPRHGGALRKAPLPQAFDGAFAPNGSLFAYNPLPPAFRIWKGYRGGTISVLHLFDPVTRKDTTVPQPPEGCNDVQPQWQGTTLYFLSDRNGEFNVHAFDPATRQVRPLTSFDAFPVESLAAAPEGTLLYLRQGRLHLRGATPGKDRPVPLALAADLPETRPRFVRGEDFIQSFAVSPSGARGVFEMRGDIVTVPAEKGDPRALTSSPGIHDRNPSWSPDGHLVAWFADDGPEYVLKLRRQDARGREISVPLLGRGMYFAPSWSPDGKKIAFRNQDATLYWIDVTAAAAAASEDRPLSPDLSKPPVEISREPLWGAPYKWPHISWAPDSRLLAFTRTLPNGLEQAIIHNVETGEFFPVSDGMADVSCPAFDPGGKYLYFFGSTDAGPAKFTLDMSTQGKPITRALYLAVLARGVSSPLARESDEEGSDTEKKSSGESDDEEDPAEPARGDRSPDQKISGDHGTKGTAPLSSDASPDTPAKASAPVSFDAEGILDRTIPLPLPSGNYSDLRPGKEGVIFYLRAENTEDGGYTTQLCSWTVSDRKEKVLLRDVWDYRVTASGEKILVQHQGGWTLGAPEDLEEGKTMALDRVRVALDPRAEWREIYRDAWRLNRDYFYDPQMYGLDWNAVYDKYLPFLDHLTGRRDLDGVLAAMLSELRVGHHYVLGGDFPDQEGEEEEIGLLGVDVTPEGGRYRLTRILGGVNWEPSLRSPLTEPGVNLRVGEFLLKVGDREITTSEDFFAPFAHTANRLVELTVASDPSGKDPRVVSVVPLASEQALRLKSWVEENVRWVEKHSGGRVSYVYMPNTATAGYEYFNRYFFSQLPREGLVLDDRNNGGGQFADYVLDTLSRRFTTGVTMRAGADYGSPAAYVEGPKVMIINESAGSGGDMLPWAFRKKGLGVLVGKRTWGGLVGITDYPSMQDGTWITAPNMGIWDEKGWIVENVGVSPDIEVAQDPAAVLEGRDPQLETALRVVLEELKKNPPRRPTRPPFPVMTPRE